jgi:hypothetical protein
LTKLGAILVKVKLFGSREHGVILRGWRSFKALETSWVAFALIEGQPG